MSQQGHNPTSEVHLRRYYRNKKNGESIQEIAAADKVDEATVKESIRAVELHRARHSVEVMTEQTAGVVLSVLPRVKNAIIRGLDAKTTVELGNGKRRKEPDYAAQRAAVAEVRGLIQTVQPKTPTVHATQVNVGQGAPRLATGSYIGMEDRLKDIEAELNSAPATEPQKQLTQSALRPIEDGEYEEAEPVESGA